MPLSVTPRTKLRRHPERAVDDRAALHAILDEVPIVHVAVATADGPRMLPMAHGRIGDALYLHGARANGLLGALVRGAQACVSATIVDGLVLARSAMHHSMQFRAAVVFAPAVEVEDETEKRRALQAILEHSLPGRAAESRPPDARELRATLVLRVPLSEASVKVRNGVVSDAEADLALPCFAGLLPVRTQVGVPQRQGGTEDSRAVERAMLRTAVNVGRITEGELQLDGDPLRLDVDRVHGWLRDHSYWARGLTRETLVQSIAGARSLGAYADGQQIGFARVVTDAATFAWLADVFVDPAARGRGVATAMVRYLRALPELAGLRKWMLGTRDAHALYERLGFAPAPTGRFMIAEG